MLSFSRKKRLLFQLGSKMLKLVMRDYHMSAIKSRKRRSRKIRWHFLSVLNPPVGENRRTRSTLKWMTAWRHPQSNRCTYQLSVALWEGWPARGKGQVPGPVKTSWLVSPPWAREGVRTTGSDKMSAQVNPDCSGTQSGLYGFISILPCCLGSQVFISFKKWFGPMFYRVMKYREGLSAELS